MSITSGSGARNNITEEDFREAISAVRSTYFPDIQALSKHQQSALWNFITGQDVFAILPTGSGKSLIFQMAPALIEQLNKKGYAVQSKPVIMIVCPLNSLIDSHIRELSKRGFKATVLTKKEDERGILNGDFTFVLCNPESIINNAKWRNMVCSELYQDNLIGFVTDEVMFKGRQ